MNHPHISVVSPVYMAEEIVPELVSRIKKSVTKITDNFEIILVEDGGTDKSWEVIEDQARKNKEIIGIKLSRNFGQHYAITAGLDHVKGEWIIVMDCDLQDQPEEIINLYNVSMKGYDLVLAKRINRKDGFLKRAYSRVFYKVLSYLTGTRIDENIANYGIYSKRVINCLKIMREPIRYFPTMIKWVGFKSMDIEVKHSERLTGKTSYTFRKLFRLATDIILAYSDKPIRIIVKTGMIISFFSFLFALIMFIRWLKGDIVVMGYASMIISIWFLSGIIISTLGMVGLYVGKTFEGVKNRPIYIIEEITR